MRPLILFVLFSCLSSPTLAQGGNTDARSAPVNGSLRLSACPAALGQSQSTGEEQSLVAAALRVGSHLVTRSERQSQEPAAARPKPKNWISRHPALLGALVGAGAGAVASGTMENELFCSGGDEDCFFHGGSRLLVGAGMGAGAGALIGWLGGR